MSRWSRALTLALFLLLPARSALAVGGDSMLNTMDRGPWHLERLFVCAVALLALALNAILLGIARLFGRTAAPSGRRPTLLGLMKVIAICAFVFGMIAIVRTEKLDGPAMATLLGVGLV